MIHSRIANNEHVHWFLPISDLVSFKCFFCQDIKRHAANARMRALYKGETTITSKTTDQASFCNKNFKSHRNNEKNRACH